MEKLKKVEIAKVRGRASAATLKNRDELAYARNSSSRAPFHADENPGPQKKIQQKDGWRQSGLQADKLF